MSAAGEQLSGYDLYRRGAAAGWAPEPDRLVSEWAPENRYLSPLYAYKHGRWSNDVFPYIVEPMDCFSVHHPAQRVVFMGGRQIAKTDGLIINPIGYWMETSPGPIGILLPGEKYLKTFSKQRLTPSIEACPSLVKRMRRRTPGKAGRGSGDTIELKMFAGGLLMLVNGSSASSVRGWPLRYLLCEEADEYKGSVGDKGDPLTIAESCTDGFPNRKIGIFGNPGTYERSRIRRQFERGDQRRYFIPCPHCGHMDILTWQGTDWHGDGKGHHHRIEWDKDGDEHLPDTAHMVCGNEQCGAVVEEIHKSEMLGAGEWRPTAKGDGTVSFQLSSLYSPYGYKSWVDCAKQFLHAVKTRDEDLLRTFVNEVLGEPWLEREGAKTTPEQVLARAEDYAAEVPNGVGILAGGVDVHDDRLEVKVTGYGADFESWLIDRATLPGDPHTDVPWRLFDEYRRRVFRHESGRDVRISCIAVDSGDGEHTDAVYRRCAARRRELVYATKGGREIQKPLVPERPTRKNRWRAPLWVLCVDSGKAQVHRRLRLETPGPGYMHLPKGKVTRAYVDSMLSEVPTWKREKGRWVRVWEVVNEENHDFDLEVLTLAALHILGPGVIKNLEARAAALAVPKPPDEEEPPASAKSEPEPPSAPVPRPPARRSVPPRLRGWVRDPWRS